MIAKRCRPTMKNESYAPDMCQATTEIWRRPTSLFPSRCGRF